MALAHDPSSIASAVLIAAGDMLFLAPEDEVDGEWRSTSDATQAGTRRIGLLRPPGDHTDGRPDTGEVSPSAQEGPRANGQAGGNVNGQRMLSSILDDWRAAERRLETARAAGDAAEIMRLGAEVTSFADEHRKAFESVLGQYDGETIRARGRHAAVPGAAVRIAQRQQV